LIAWEPGVNATYQRPILVTQAASITLSMKRDNSLQHDSSFYNLNNLFTIWNLVGSLPSVCLLQNIVLKLKNKLP